MNSFSKTLAGLIALLIGLSSGVGCTNTQIAAVSNPTDPWGSVTINPDQPIRIGLAVSQSDPALGREGLEQVRGAELALHSYQQIRGFRVELVPSDTSCSSNGGEATASTLVADANIVAVVGPSCTSACIKSAPLFDNAHFTAVSGFCGSDELTQPTNHKDAFLRTMYSDSTEGALAAQYVYSELGKRQVALLSYRSADTADFVAAFRLKFEALGGVIAGSVTVNPDERDYAAELNTLGGMKAEIIYAPLFAADAVKFLQEKQKSPLGNVPVIGSRYYWSQWFVDTLGGGANNVYATGPYLKSAGLTKLVSDYRQSYNEPPSSTLFAYTYDATTLLLKSVGEAAQIDSTGHLFVGRKALHDAITSMSGFEGTTGSLTCTSWGDCSVASIAVGQLKEGKWTPVFVP